MRNLRISVMLFALSLGVLVLSSACGGGDGESEPSAVRPLEVATQTPVPQVVATTSRVTPVLTPATEVSVLENATKIADYELENVRYGGTFNRVVVTHFGNLDPKINNQNIGTETVGVYETLATWEPNTNDNFAHLAPNLAESWKASPDLKTYTFMLRKGVRWQDLPPVNGRELIAEDVAFSLRRYMEPSSVWAGTYSQIESINAPDKSTVVIKLKQPTAWAVNDLFLNVQFVVPPELVEEMKGDLGLRVIGTGPYIMKEYRFRQSTTFIRNPNYWKRDIKGNVLPYVDAKKHIFATDRATMVAAFRTSQVDNLPTGPGGASPEDIVQVSKSMPGIRVYTSPSTARFGLAFNTKRAPWNDVKVRRAINMAIDKTKYIESYVTVKSGWETYGPLPWSHISDKPFSFTDLGPYYQYNPAESKKLREASGFSDGKLKIGTPVVYSSIGAHVPRMSVLKELLRLEGIDLPIQGIDRTVFQDTYYNRPWEDLGLTFQNTGDFSLNWFAQNKYLPENFQNSSWIDDPEVRKVAQAIQVTTDAAKLREYARFLWDFDTLGSWYIWLPIEFGYSANSPRVRNNTVRAGSGSFSNQAVLEWLSDAPRTTP